MILKNTPVSVYGATKLSNEIIANAYSKILKWIFWD